MITQTKKLAAALSACARIVKGRTALPILSCVKLEAVDSVLTVQATTCDIWVTRKVECEGELPACCVGVNRLLRLVEASQGEQAALELNGQRLTLKAGVVSQLSIIDTKDFPKSPVIGKELAGRVDGLADGIEAVEWLPNSEPNKDYRITRSNVLVELGPNSIDCIGFTGTVMARFNRALIYEPRSLLIPIERAAALVPALREPNATAHATDSHISAQNDGGSVSVKLAEGQYGNWREFFKTRPPFMEMDTETLLRGATCSQALFETDVRYPQLNITLTGEVLEMSSNEGDNSYSESLPFQSPPASIRLNARFLLNALRHLGGKTVKCAAEENGSIWANGDLEVRICQLVGQA